MAAEKAAKKTTSPEQRRQAEQLGRLLVLGFYSTGVLLVIFVAAMLRLAKLQPAAA